MDVDGSGFWFVFWIVFIVLVIPKWRHAVLPRVVPPLRDAVDRLRGTVASNGASNGAARGGRQDAAMTILRERFARGEIDRAEYETRRDVLTGNGSSDTWHRV